MINKIIRKVIMVAISATIFGKVTTEAMVVEKVFEGGELFEDVYIATDVNNRPYIIVSDDLEVADFIEFESNGMVITECEYIR